jgi:hypothetical protein
MAKGSSKESFQPGHEERDVSARLLAIGAILFVASGVVMHFGLSAYFWALNYAMPSAPRQNLSALIPQREPRLSNTLRGDYQQYSLIEERRLHQYGWENRATGQVRIPIEQAMETMLNGH